MKLQLRPLLNYFSKAPKPKGLNNGTSQQCQSDYEKGLSFIKKKFERKITRKVEYSILETTAVDPANAQVLLDEGFRMITSSGLDEM